MTPTRDAVVGEGGVVRIPADLDRPDCILLGLSARQLGILAAGGLAAWIIEALAEPLVGVAAAVILAAPLALAGLGLALGWRDGLPLDRLALAALSWWRHPRRLVPAPDGVPPTPTWAGPAGPPVAPLTGPIHDFDSSGVVDLGGLGWALVCQATPVNLSLRTPGEQQALLASFTRLLHALTGPMQILVRADRADLTPLVEQLGERAAALPHPGLEQAALQHARWLDSLTGDQGVRRRELLVVFHQPPATPEPAAVLRRQAEQATGLLAAAGVTLTPLDGQQAGRVLHAASNPDRPPRPVGLAAAAATITGRWPA
jgi:PrgI family protein